MYDLPVEFTASETVTSASHTIRSKNKHLKTEFRKGRTLSEKVPIVKMETLRRR